MYTKNRQTGDHPAGHLEIRPVVMSGPSGAGKSTVLKALMDRYPNVFAFSVSHTSRGPRPGEVDGRDYHFATKEVISKLIEEGQFLENAEFAGNIYGTSKASVKEVLNSGKVCILDVDIEGVKSIKRFPELQARFVFISPPSLQTLEARLRGRGTETEEKVQARLSRAQADMDYASVPGNYDLVVINDDLNRATNELEKYLKADIDKVVAMQK